MLAHDMNYVALKLLAPEHLLFTNHALTHMLPIIVHRSLKSSHIVPMDTFVHTASHLLAADTALPIAGRIIKFAHADKQSRPVTYWYVTS